MLTAGHDETDRGDNFERHKPVKRQEILTTDAMNIWSAYENIRRLLRVMAYR